jgi:gamma-glutamylcyclotransferase (GGCT)/AIG2-like uncharacterized protein YtfP
MPLLFSYGTLQQENVQLSTFGRLLQGQRDELPGFEQSLVRIEDPQVVATSGKTHHANVTFNGRNDSRVSGTVFEITGAELASADQYEQPAAYKRVATMLASGKQAWVYVAPALRRELPGLLYLFAGLPFDHSQLLERALATLRDKVEREALPLHLQ